LIFSSTERAGKTSTAGSPVTTGTSGMMTTAGTFGNSREPKTSWTLAAACSSYFAKILTVMVMRWGS